VTAAIIFVGRALFVVDGALSCIQGRGCCLPPFVLCAWQRRGPLWEHHPGRPCQSSGPESRSTLSDGREIHQVRRGLVPLLTLLMSRILTSNGCGEWDRSREEEQ
jgi:hypothetical protein